MTTDSHAILPTDSKDMKDATKFTNLFHVMCEFGDSSDQCHSVPCKGLAVLDIRRRASASLVLKIGNFCLQSIQYLRMKLKLNKCKFTTYVTLVSSLSPTVLFSSTLRNLHRFAK